MAPKPGGLSHGAGSGPRTRRLSDTNRVFGLLNFPRLALSSGLEPEPSRFTRAEVCHSTSDSTKMARSAGFEPSDLRRDRATGTAKLPYERVW